jgi:polysaccharide chain length determinant protein (PEP-CTERM system associated)
MADNIQVDEEQESSSPAFSRLSILRTLWKRKIRISLAWILFTIAGVAVVRLFPAVYLAETVVVVDSQQIPEKFVSPTVATDLEDRIATIRQMLLSSGELKKIIDDFGLYKEARKTHFEEEILEMMRKDISITLEPVGSGNNNKRTVAFRIGFQGSDPMLVMRVANRLTDVYVDEYMKTREAQAAGTSDFLQTQLRESKKRLDELEAAVSAYKVQHNGELPQQEPTLANTLSRLQTELEVNRDAINRVQQTRVILEGNLNAMEVTLGAQVHSWEQAQHATGANVTFSPTGQPVTQKKESEVLQEQLDMLRVRYNDSHPDVVRLRADIERVKQIEKQREAAKSSDTPKEAQAKPGVAADPPAREPLEFAHTREQVAGLKAQIKASDKELEDRKAEQQRILHDLAMYQQRLEQLPVREQDMARLMRDYEMSKENYKSLLDKKMAADMSLDMETRQQSERFTVLDRAQVPEKPIKPKRPLLYAGAVVLGLALALVLGFSAEMRRNVVLGEWELPPGTPVLARLPYIAVQAASGKTKSPERSRWFSRRKGLANGVTALFLAAGAGHCLHTLLHRL